MQPWQLTKVATLGTYMAIRQWKHANSGVMRCLIARGFTS
eukprot:CAMPEP_0117496880 /NCGR_PEP_ID=MMETSP0784-20121206/20888_1 /TAXON_ID=39447 /ORGANISM="" /LENGTH=39 /DNA_ID= /DNA_START= /DNA_END= /DNA_ORIENTATION=